MPFRTVRLDVLVVASGTATVEGLLSDIPMVVVYRVATISYILAKLLVKVRSPNGDRSYAVHTTR